MAFNAGKIAVEMYEHLRGNIGYSISGAAKSLISKKSFNSRNCQSILQNLAKGGDEAFFCSGHVVLCYQAVMDGMRMAQNVFPIQHAAQVFSMAHSCYNPSILAQTLHKSNHFRILGTFKRGIKVG